MTSIMRGNTGKVRYIGPARVVNNSVICVHSVSYSKVALQSECSFLLKAQNIMSVYDDILQEDASSVEMKKKTKEMKIRVAKVIFITFLYCAVSLFA